MVVTNDCTGRHAGTELREAGRLGGSEGLQMRPATTISTPLHLGRCWSSHSFWGLTRAPHLGLGEREIIIKMYMGVGGPMQLLGSFIDANLVLQISELHQHPPCSRPGPVWARSSTGSICV